MPRNVGSGSRLRSASNAIRAAWIGRNASKALTPSVRMLPCADRPATSIRNVSAPAVAVMILALVGSVITAASPMCPRRSVANAPSPPSSSPTTKCRASGRSSRTPAERSVRSTARLAAAPAFMSQAPRP